MKTLLFVFLFLFTLPLFSQDDAMPAYVLIRAVDNDNPEEPMTWKTGFPVVVMPRNQIGGSQIPPNFVQCVISDATVAQVKTYLEEWKREIDWEFVSHNLPVDVHTLKVFTKPELVSASGLNGLTRDKVEAFLNRWGGTVDGIDKNSVVFSVGVADAIASEGFWDANVPASVFTELSYDSVTGIHSTRIAYGTLPITAANLAARIVENGCKVTAHNAGTKRMTFSCSRDNVFSKFKQSVIERVDQFYARRRWYFTQAFVDAALANNGSITMTRQEALEVLHNRLLD